MAATDEPMLARLDRLDHLLKHFEEIKRYNRTPKSSCASTPSSGTLTSDGQASSVDFSPKSLEKHCRPIDDVIVEIERKGTLMERVAHLEDHILKLGQAMEAEKKKRNVEKAQKEESTKMEERAEKSSFSANCTMCEPEQSKSSDSFESSADNHSWDNMIDMTHLTLETENSSSSLEFAANNDVEGFEKLLDCGSSKVNEIGLYKASFRFEPNAVDLNGLRPFDVIVVAPKLPRLRAFLEELLMSNASNGFILEQKLRMSFSSSPSSSPPLYSSPKSSDLPANPSMERKECPIDPSVPDIKFSIYTTDEFRMFSFKIRPCSSYSHDWTECPFVHPRENARRRDPRKYHCSCVPCPDFRKEELHLFYLSTGSHVSSMHPAAALMGMAAALNVFPGLLNRKVDWSTNMGFELSGRERSPPFELKNIGDYRTFRGSFFGEGIISTRVILCGGVLAGSDELIRTADEKLDAVRRSHGRPSENDAHPYEQVLSASTACLFPDLQLHELSVSRGCLISSI
ncbi:hypothetical protein Nepgr_022449 [Nepenthes gracilis]|uniref:AtC3H23-like CCCH zinc finger domain-containing protein n=1 Tax=Nepenthes gracilis TaxID=150966 RepID=A0AAD3XX01_NEPGR|nr:hypothetical protein Nepgr_022449 [Nepenthes gracilis]